MVLTVQEGIFRLKINQKFYRRELSSFFGTKSCLLQGRWEFLLSKRTAIDLFDRRLKSTKWRSLLRIFWLNCIIANPVGKDIQFNRVTLTGMSRLLIMTYTLNSVQPMPTFIRLRAYLSLQLTKSEYYSKAQLSVTANYQSQATSCPTIPIH